MCSESRSPREIRAGRPNIRHAARIAEAPILRALDHEIELEPLRDPLRDGAPHAAIERQIGEGYRLRERHAALRHLDEVVLRRAELRALLRVRKRNALHIDRQEQREPRDEVEELLRLLPFPSWERVGEALPRSGDRTLAIVPDLICILDRETAEPITTENLKYGQRVKVVGASVPPIMRSARALEVWGPRAFGFDEPFVPIEAST